MMHSCRNSLFNRVLQLFDVQLIFKLGVRYKTNMIYAFKVCTVQVLY